MEVFLCNIKITLFKVEKENWYERLINLIVTNPPYGERISTPDLIGTYRMIGERLKHAFQGNEAWVLSYREECFDAIGLKPSIKIPLYNGSLECEFRKYQMFEGRLQEFRSEGGIVKTEEELKAMADKHRFKKNREFKKHLDEEEENEGADIRSFKFHSFEKNYKGELRGEKNEERGARGERGFGRKDRNDKKDWKDQKDRNFRGPRRERESRDGRDSRGFDRGERRGGKFDKGGKRFGKGFDKKRRFDDED